MKIALFLAIDKGGSPLENGLRRVLPTLGHETEEYIHSRSYDLILVFNNCSHTCDYKYPEFPTCNTPIAFIDTGEYGWKSRLPDKVKRYANAFSEGSVSHEFKDTYQQERLRQFLEGKSFPYFLREHFKAIEYPSCYHPIDYPLYNLSADVPPPDRDEYLKRQLDVYVSWRTSSHAWRDPITREIASAGVNSEILLIDDHLQVKAIPQAEYFAKMWRAKILPCFDGFGSGSFRMMEALVRAPLLMAPLAIRTREPLIEGETCMMFDVKSQGKHFESTNIAPVLMDVLEYYPEYRWKVYSQGYEHCMRKYTETAVAQYILDTVEAHDWNAITPLNIQ